MIGSPVAGDSAIEPPAQSAGIREEPAFVYVIEIETLKARSR